MSDRAEVAVIKALFARAQAFATAQSLTISFPNQAFTPPTASPTAMWLRATVLPADSFALSINNGGPNQHHGTLQIDVFYGQNGGSLAPMRIAAEAAVYFKFGTTMTQDGFTVQVMDAPRIREGIKDDPWVMVPVRIPYRSLADGP